VVYGRISPTRVSPRVLRLSENSPLVTPPLKKYKTLPSPDMDSTGVRFEVMTCISTHSPAVLFWYTFITGSLLTCVTNTAMWVPDALKVVRDFATVGFRRYDILEGICFS